MKLIMKSDREPSVEALKRAVALRRQAAATLIESPVWKSQSNGVIERAIRAWESQFRTLKHQFGGNLNSKLEMSHPLVEWMTVWAGELVSRYVLRENGRTAIESITGHRCKQPAFLFAEIVMFRLAPGNTNMMKVESHWHIGIFIGVESRSQD